MPSPETSNSNSRTGKIELDYLTRIEAAMQNPVQSSTVKMWLEKAQALGVDPERLYERAVKLYEGVGAEVNDQRAACLLSLGIASRETGELEDARRRLAEAGALAGQIGEAGVKAGAEKELKKVEKIIAGRKK